MHTPRAVALVALAFAVGGCVTSPSRGPSLTPSPSSRVGSASPRPTAPIVAAPVVARIQLPSDGGAANDPRTPFPDEYAVSDGAIWITYPLEPRLVRIDLGGNGISHVTPLDWAATVVVGAGGVWAYGPYGYAPGPDVASVFRVRPGTGELEPFAEIRDPGGHVAAAAGSVWADGEGGWWRLDPATGQRIAVIESQVYNLSEACESIWGHNDTDNLLRLDPVTLAVVGSYPTGTGFPIGSAERCWLVGDGGVQALTREDPLPSPAPFRSPLMPAGETLWVVSGHVIQRFDPEIAAGVGPRWALDPQDIPPNVKGESDWRLLSAGGSLWLLNRDQLLRLDIPA